MLHVGERFSALPDARTAESAEVSNASVYSCVWPTGGELYRYTLVVIFTVILLGVFIGGTDYLLGAISKATIYNNGVH